jgi:hypothetical protein
MVDLERKTVRSSVPEAQRGIAGLLYEEES